LRSLFARILLWFLATTAVTVTGLIVTRWLSLNAAPGQQSPFTRMVPFLLVEARYAYETGGQPSLAQFMARMQKVYDVQGILTDASGRDLLTGEDRSDLVRRFQGRSYWRVGRNHVIVARRSEDGRYSFFFPVVYRRIGYWVLIPQDLWLIGAVALLCYWLARHLTEPVRRLQRAVERFGQGDLSTRFETGRRDEIGDLARTFNRMADRIQTLLAAERRLLLDISHELRSPLARLGVAVELARSGQDREGALDRIQKEADRLNSLVGELLQVTRAEGDPASLHFESVRLDDLVSDIVETNRIEATARGAELKLDTEAAAEIQGNPELLRRALENVIRNAIRHAPAGTAVEVTVKGCSIVVRDYGPGVPEEDLARIFDPFYRVENDRNRSSGGAGLGLAIARRAVELHKGTIHARNADPGLLVSIELSSPTGGSACLGSVRL
jgi:two-component system, OmpR family, sensor kinase